MVGSDSVGARIRAAREARGMSMSELARAAGLSPGAVSRIERGEREPGSGTLAAMARALGSGPGELLGRGEAPRALAPVQAPTAVMFADQVEPVDRTVLQAIETIARRMPAIPPAGRRRVLGVILALLGDGAGVGESP